MRSPAAVGHHFHESGRPSSWHCSRRFPLFHVPEHPASNVIYISGSLVVGTVRVRVMGRGDGPQSTHSALGQRDLSGGEMHSGRGSGHGGRNEAREFAGGRDSYREEDGRGHRGHHRSYGAKYAGGHDRDRQVGNSSGHGHGHQNGGGHGQRGSTLATRDGRDREGREMAHRGGNYGNAYSTRPNYVPRSRNKQTMSAQSLVSSLVPSPSRYSQGSDSSEEDTECPVCCNDLDVTDKHMRYCECGFRPCLWCYHQILEEAQKDSLPARCPNCRSEYDQNKISMQHIEEDKLEEEKLKLKKGNKGALPGPGLDQGASTGVKGKQPNYASNKAHLANIRVVQPNLVYTVGLAMDICHEDVLKEPAYFGQFGKLVKISVNRTNQYVSSHASKQHGPTGSAYVTFKRPEDALKCIKQIDGETWKGRQVKACFGTTKYCNAFLKGVTCTNPECLYLHEFADDEDCLTKEEVAAGLLPVRFMAMGATNTFKPRLTIHNVGGGHGGHPQQKYVIHTRDGDQEESEGDGRKRSVLVQKVGGGGQGRVGDAPGETTVGGVAAGAIEDASLPLPPPPPPPPPPPQEKGLWAAAAGSATVPAGAAHGVPPPTSDVQQWPTLAGGIDGFGGGLGVVSAGGAPSVRGMLSGEIMFGTGIGGVEATNSSPMSGTPVESHTSIEKAPSMAEQLTRARSSTTDSSTRLAVLSGMNRAPTPKLIPLTSPAQMKAVTKMVPKKADAKKVAAKAAEEQKKKDASTSRSIEGPTNGASSAAPLLNEAASNTHPPQSMQGLQGLQGIQLPPGFGSLGVGVGLGGGIGVGFDGVAGMDQHVTLTQNQAMGQSHQPSLSAVSDDMRDSLAKPQVQPVRKHSRFAFAQQDDAAHTRSGGTRNLGNLCSAGDAENPLTGRSTLPSGGLPVDGVHPLHANGSFDAPESLESLDLSKAGTFFQSLFPGVHVNVSSTPGLSGVQTGAGAEGMGSPAPQLAGGRPNAPPGFSKPSSQDVAGIALLRQLQISGAGDATSPGAGSRRLPPGFGNV